MLTAGARLGPYEVIAPAGAGGMGEVYKARDTRLGREVAIKVLPGHLSASPEARQRFEREAKTISTLSHPHICTLYDVGNQEGVEYLVMEYLEGETLADRLARGPLPLEQTLRYGVEIAEALDRAHRQGIAHRDLKPGNVMLTKSGVKLLDFGLARAIAPASPAAMLSALPTQGKPLTAEGTILGTFQYMAPEQLEGKETDARTDIFALGAMLYEMTTGHRAFSGTSQASLISSIMQSDPSPISTTVPLAPRELDRAVLRCLAKDPERRWQNARDVALELEWLAQARQEAGGAPAPAPSRRRAVWIAWGIALASLLLLIASLSRGRGAQRPRGVVRFTMPAPPGTAYYFSGRDAGPVAVSPDGTSLAFVAVGENGRKRLYVRRLAELSAQALAGADGAAYPFWSPDSAWIGFFSDGKLKKVPSRGGPVQVLCNASAGRGGTWNREGVIVFAAGAEDPLSKISEGGGTPAPVTALDPKDTVSSHRWPHFLPDGRHFLFTAFNVLMSGPESGNSIFLGSLESMDKSFLIKASKAEYVSPGYLVFVRDRTLFVAPFDARAQRLTGEPKALMEDVQFFPNTGSAIFSVSPTGVLAYELGNVAPNSRLVWFDRSGKDVGSLGPPGDWEDPRVSPDGTKIATNRLDSQTGMSNIWLVGTESGSATRFTFAPTVEHGPVWSPDGSRLAFDSFRVKPVHIYQKSLNGKDEEVLVRADDFKTPTDWSRDGRFLVYQSLNPKTQWDLWYVDLSGSRAPIAFLRTSFNEMGGQLSPDGRWLAYSSDESGSWEVYVTAFPGPGGKWQVSAGGGSQPIWRRDGSEIFYLSSDRTLMAATVANGKELALLPSRPLFPTYARYTGNRAFDVSADGQRFLISTMTIEQPPGPLTLVLDLASELSAR